MDEIPDPFRVLVVGLGNMGRSHAQAYADHPGFRIVGLVDRLKVETPLEAIAGPIRPDFEEAFDDLRPDLVSINTYSDSHAALSIHAMERGAHVFVEKPLATDLEDARRVIDCARQNKRKLVIGYILRHHPSWNLFIAEARKLGGPYIFRMNLNQQSSGDVWRNHKQLLKTASPIVDCGVHYIDVMCQITDAQPLEVRGAGVRLARDIDTEMYNYGHLQILFEDGSAGWFEAGWGPMISECAFFVKDVLTPNGSISIMMPDTTGAADPETYTRTSAIRIHPGRLNMDGEFAEPDRHLRMEDEPGHAELCARQQDFVYRAIRDDIDLTRHMQDALHSLRICIAADRSIRTGKPVDLRSVA